MQPDIRNILFCTQIKQNAYARYSGNHKLSHYRPQHKLELIPGPCEGKYFFIKLPYLESRFIPIFRK